MRKELLGRVRRVVVKVGSGVIFGSDGLDLDVIDALSRDICQLLAEGYEIVLVSSGAVATGKGDLGIVGRPPTIPLKQAAAAIGQSRLMRAYKDAFRRCDRRVAQILLTRDDLANRRRFLNARNTLMTLLEYGVTPIINENDTVVVEEIRFGDNDNLSALVTSLAEADLLVILSDVDGLYDRNPKTDPAARRLPVVECITEEIEHMAGGAGSVVGVLPAVLAGQELGTFFLPVAKHMTARKHWISFTKRSRGKLVVDAGARRAVVEKGKSLLPSGVRSVEGKFDRGDAVRICDGEGREFAKGIAGYSCQELVRIMGRNSTEIETILGYKYGDEVIHRDNMVVKR
jgi:glutamate 5-kinase